MPYQYGPLKNPFSEKTLKVNDTQMTNIPFQLRSTEWIKGRESSKQNGSFGEEITATIDLLALSELSPLDSALVRQGHAHMPTSVYGALHETKHTIGWWNCNKYKIVNADLGCIQCCVKHASAYQLVFCLKDAQALWKHCICPLNLEQKRNTVNNASV